MQLIFSVFHIATHRNPQIMLLFLVILFNLRIIKNSCFKLLSIFEFFEFLKKFNFSIFYAISLLGYYQKKWSNFQRIYHLGKNLFIMEPWDRFDGTFYDLMLLRNYKFFIYLKQIQVTKKKKFLSLKSL